MHHILVWFQPAVFARNVALVAESNLIFRFWFTKQIVSVLCHSRLSKIWDSNISMEFIFPRDSREPPYPSPLEKDNRHFFREDWLTCAHRTLVYEPMRCTLLPWRQCQRTLFLKSYRNTQETRNVIEIHKKEEML